MPEAKLPAGFELQKYPNVETGHEDDLYVCNECVPAWDTFHRSEAERHANEGKHNRLGAPPVRQAGAA